MRALVQRVSSAVVELVATGERVGAIGPGLLAFVGVTHQDTATEVTRLADKLWNLRVLADGNGAMNASLAARAELGATASLLVVSQFTLYGDTSKGRRPSFMAAAGPEHAEALIEDLVLELRELGAEVSTGRFGQEMAVSLTNDGPVTVMLEV